MMAGLAKVEHQSKILAKVTTLTSLEQKFNRLVNDRQVDHCTIHPVKLSNVQWSDGEGQSQKVKTSLTPQYPNLYSGCRRTSHLNGLEGLPGSQVGMF